MLELLEVTPLAFAFLHSCEGCWACWREARRCQRLPALQLSVPQDTRLLAEPRPAQLARSSDMCLHPSSRASLGFLRQGHDALLRLLRACIDGRMPHRGVLVSHVEWSCWRRGCSSAPPPCQSAAAAPHCCLPSARQPAARPAASSEHALSSAAAPSAAFSWQPAKLCNFWLMILTICKAAAPPIKFKFF